ncbi:MAG: hypothetical protein FWC76_00040 [Defluviitaleaceae bacterium]|nr:hypothetical protein [Defluviitaleaceae bacterium]
METKLARMALFRILLLIAGLICLALSMYYLYQLTFLGLWHDTNIRIPRLIQFFGGVTFIVLGRILKNQEDIIRLLYERRNDSENAGFTDKERPSGDAQGQ